MSIKDLFGKSFKSYQSASSDVESPNFVTEEVVKRETFVPEIDFSTASNFAIYGSAELYYQSSISRIYDNYPYDGSDKEKTLFELSSSYLDNWIFNSKYPKSTGYAILGTTGYTSTLVDGYGETSVPEYIRTWGGLHTASTNTNKLSGLFAKSAKYDLSLNRTQNWRLDLVSGSTVEFWLKKDSFNLADTEREVILDLWNGEASSSANYGRLTLELTGTSGACFVATLQSGSDGFYRQLVSSTNVTTSSLGSWNHYAVSFVSASGGIDTRFYVNGQEDETQTLGTGIGEIYGRIDGYIGALQTSPSSSAAPAYAGKLSASMDEFRFWKTRRTSNEINLNWFTNVGGGANSDDETSNNNLGVYYKFNEGIVNQSSVDQNVLDYSGRLANGLWQGYTSNSQRSTGSAFTLSSYEFEEIGDPIIYDTHPDVSSLYSEMTLSGSEHDNTRGTSLFKSMPEWIQNEDIQSDSNLKYITQILSSYLDTLHAQIGAISGLKNKKYIQEGNKALPFAKSLLTDKGFMINEIFADSKVVEIFGNKDASSTYYEENLNEIKNLIYTNIYNNLEKIYKSKGTETSIRNLIRCFGVDDEIVKLNMYTDGGTHYFSDKAKGTSVKKKYINFDDPDYFSSTLYQTSSNTNPLTFISGTLSAPVGSNSALTFEVDIVVPYKKETLEIGFYNTPFVSSSIFGFHEAIESDPSDYTWATSDVANLSVYLVRDKIESKRAKFVIENQDGTISLSSNYIEDIYDNNHWNLAVRMKPDTYPYAGNVTNNNPNYTIDFYAVSHNVGEIEDEVSLSQSISSTSGSAFLSNPKRVYAGAHKLNFTGSTLEQSDVQVGSVRVWADYLGNDVIKQHNLDPLNFGTSKTFRGSNIFALNNVQVPTQELTIFNWDFDTVTGSDSSQQFIIDDITSGSTDTIYGPFDEIIRREYRGRGDYFGSNKTTFIENEFLYAQKKELPEISFTNDNIFIKGDRDKFFITDEDVSDNFYMIEKSMGQVVSEEMLKMFSTVQEFANLIGRPVDKYRINYKRLEKVRDHFFSTVESDMDPEKFIQYYRWIDASISHMISQLIPATVNFGEGVSDVVESHILERSKYQRRPGLLDTIQSTEGSLRGIEELTYNWKFGHAPTGSDENVNCLWQKQRKERTDINDRDRIRQVLENETDISPPNLSQPDKTIYQGSTYALRRLSRPYKVKGDFSDTIHGGTNYVKQKDRDFYKSTITVHGESGSSGAPRNIYTIGLGTGSHIINPVDCQDVENPNKKVFYQAVAVAGKYATEDAQAPNSDAESYLYKLNTTNYWPWNIKSGTVDTGYATEISDFFQSGTTVTNLHSDTTDFTNEVPMQGPFTNAHVGGMQNRHVKINKYDTTLVTEGGGSPINNIDDQYTRPEAYRILFANNGIDDPDPDTAMGIVGPDYGGGYPDESRKWAIYYREERAKRPVNIRNIETELDSPVHGNYQFQYEVLSTFGNQRHLFRRATGSLLPESIGRELPQTTNYMTLVGQAPFPAGNIFGGGQYSNRQPDGSTSFPAVSGTFAEGGFSVYGKDFVKTGKRIRIDSVTWGVSGSSATHVVNTGSSDTEFWDNLSSSIETNGGYSINYTTTSAVFSKGAAVDARDQQFLSASLDTSQIRTGQFALSSWVIFGSGSNTGRNVLYRETNDPTTDILESTDGRDIFINTAGTLRFLIHYSGSTGFTRDIYDIANFRSNYFDERLHLVFTHDGTLGAATGELYINAVSQSWTDISLDALGAGTGSTLQNAPTDVFFLNTNATTDHTLFAGTNKSYVDEIIILASTASAGAAEALYNCGKRISDLSAIYHVVPSASLAQYWGFESTSFADESTIIGQGSETLNLTVNNPGGLASESGSAGACYSEFQYANFQLTASVTGSAKNGPVTEEGSGCISYFNEIGLSGGTDATPASGVDANDIVIEIPRTDLTSSQHIIQNRFSAPGGPEINSRGYRDIATGEYSVYNAINYRNLTVRASGSGEKGTIRVNSHANRREGLRTLLSRHCGQFGIDSQHGSVSGTTYEAEASFHKQHRNTLMAPRVTSERQSRALYNPHGLSALERASLTYPYPTTGDVSFSFWINATITSGTSCALDASDNGGNDVYKIQINSNQIELIVTDADSNVASISIPYTSVNEWNHFVFCWPSSSSKAPKVYLNGIEQTATVTGLTSFNYLREQTTSLDILNSSPIGDELDGSLSNLAIYNAFFTDQEALDLYNNNGDALSFPSLGLILDYWLLGEEDSISDVAIGDRPTGEIRSEVGKNYLRFTSKPEIEIALGPYQINIAEDEGTYNNMYLSSLLPASDFQYSWVNSAISGSNWLEGQKIRGYAPKSGEIRLVGGGSLVKLESAITFPTASTLYGE